MSVAVELHPVKYKTAFLPELRAWALEYARRGYPIFPVRPDKRPYVKWKYGATTDTKQIVTWWNIWPLAMIGMPTGKPSGLVVLDVDSKNGVNGFETLKRNRWVIPHEAVHVVTPSGGAHFYFQYDEGQNVRNSAGKIGPGLDLRGDGGFIVLPPSRPHFDGADYHYAEGQNCERGQLSW